MEHIWYDVLSKKYYGIKGNCLYQKTVDPIGNSYYKLLTEPDVFSRIDRNIIILIAEVNRLSGSNRRVD